MMLLGLMWVQLRLCAPTVIDGDICNLSLGDEGLHYDSAQEECNLSLGDEGLHYDVAQEVNCSTPFAFEYQCLFLSVIVHFLEFCLSLVLHQNHHIVWVNNYCGAVIIVVHSNFVHSPSISVAMKSVNPKPCSVPRGLCN